MPTTVNGQKRFTIDERRTALERYKRDGPAAAAAMIGADSSTVSHWARQAGLTTDRAKLDSSQVNDHERRVTRGRAKIESLLVKATILNLEDSLKSATSAKDRQALAMATGINLDKLAMLRGELKPGTAPSAESRRAMLQSGRERSAKLRAV